MQHLFGSTQTLLLAALLLVVVASLPAAEALTGSRARLRVPVTLAAIVGGFVLFGLALRESPVLPDVLPYRVVRYAAVELDQAVEPNVLVFDGGSYVLNGVDTEILEAELGKLGYEARALRFAAGAANHFERYHMQASALRRTSRKPEPRQRWLYLTEVQREYDAQPLAQFGDNLDTARTYDYLTVQNAFHAVRALRAPDSEVPLDGAWRWPLLRHTLINATSTGAFQRLVPEAGLGFHTGEVSDPPRRGRFKFKGMSSTLSAARRKSPKAGVPGWLSQVREPRSRELWADRLDELVYFGLPTTKPQQVDYVRAFCRSTRAKCFAPAEKQLLQELDDKRFWRNATHLSRAGAIVYTRWLARQLADSGALQKR